MIWEAVRTIWHGLLWVLEAAGRLFWAILLLVVILAKLLAGVGE